MIDSISGEVSFEGFVLRPHQRMVEVVDILEELHFPFEVQEDSPKTDLTTVIPEFPFENEYGRFDLECTFDSPWHLVLVTVSHRNDFYEANTPNDGERTVFHEQIIHRDLAGQREFGWGEILSFLCEVTNRHHIGIFYTPGPGVPRGDDFIPLELVERKLPQGDPGAPTSPSAPGK